LECGFANAGRGPGDDGQETKGATMMGGWMDPATGSAILVTPSADYCYDERWRSGVDRNSEEGRAYCQARTCVRRFLTVEIEMGRECAHADWQEHLSAIARRHGVPPAERLAADFRLEGVHEGAALRSELACGWELLLRLARQVAFPEGCQAVRLFQRLLDEELLVRLETTQARCLDSPR
jgi:hypothetical protein